MSKESQESYLISVDLPPKVMEDFEKAAEKRKLSTEQRRKLLEEVKRVYIANRWEPAEAIGIIAAQSISEPSTQMTMRAYHFAGSAGVRVTQGLPRLIEIFDAKKEPETPFTTIFLKKEHDNKEEATKLAEDIVEKRIKDLIRNISMNLGENSLEIEFIDKRKVEKAAKKLKETLKGFEVKERTGTLVIKPKEAEKKKAKGKEGEEEEGVDVKKIREKVLETSMEGIKGVSSAIVRREGEEWTINTVGSNFEEVLNLPEVDTTRTTTNNIFEVEKVLGIEAARNAVIGESTSTLHEQGLDVDIRHLNLVSDIMTFSGHIEAIGRYGVAGAKTSILARAAFEETIKHLVRASVRNEKDELRGIFENVMVGQVIPSGTGMFELLARKKEKEAKKKEEEKKE